MLYVQLRIGSTILPALVDSGACDNIISEQAVADMHLSTRHLAESNQDFIGEWPAHGVCVVCGCPSRFGRLVVPTQLARDSFIGPCHLVVSILAPF